MRGRGRGRGRGANPPRRHQPPIQPFITDELENINMELELLREKKNIIEKHQHMLQNYSNYNQFQGGYNSVAPPHYEDDIYGAPGPSRSRNYSHFEEESYPPQEYVPFNRGKKRRAEYWSGPSKRFSGPDRNVAQSFGGRLGPIRHTSTPNPNQKQDHRSKTAKKKARWRGDDDMTLRPDSEPSPKLRARLQLGLGHILKHMKNNFSKKENFFRMMHTHPYLNNIKMELRKRIYKVMMNKLVNTPDQVEQLYREQYPANTDTLFLAKISQEIATTTSKPDILNESVVAVPMNPGPYRNIELPHIIDAEVDEVFRKLEIMYNPKLDDTTKTYRLSHNQITPNIQEEKIPEEEKTEEIMRWKLATREKIHKLVPRMLLKNVNHITKLLKMDLVYVNTCTDVVNQPGRHMDDIHMQVTEATAGLPQFCARVRAIPKLPTTTVMRPFLNQFNPVWVKKKKLARNVLYVAFRDEESLKKLLEKDGFDFGSCFLKIGRMNTRAKMAKKQNIKNRKIAQNSDEHNISANLNDQINDLISSIRQAEYDDGTNSENSDDSEIYDVSKENDKPIIDLVEYNDNNLPTEGAVTQNDSKDEAIKKNGDVEQNNDAQADINQEHNVTQQVGTESVENTSNVPAEVDKTSGKEDKEAESNAGT